jgi:hypothetical protein
MCDDVAVARELLAGGTDVVLVVAPGQQAPVGALRDAGPGRLAVVVGSLADEATREAAAELAAELWGRRA